MKQRRCVLRWNISAIFLAALTATQLGYPASAQQRGEHWVPTWVTAAQTGGQVRLVIPRPDGSIPPAPAANAAPAPGSGFNNQTIRMIVHTSIPGRRARVQLSNAHGAVPVRVGSVHIARRANESAIVPGSDRALMFSGKPAFTIPPGAIMTSDPVDFDVPQLGDLAVSIYLPSDTGPATNHATGLHTTYVKEGDATGQPEIPDGAKRQSYYFLSSVEVAAPAGAAAMVAFGDSITDGSASTPNKDSSWPADLARRMLANAATSQIAVLNEGIAGNRVTRDGLGEGGLARFDRDVLMQPGVKWVSLLMGINDIGAGVGEPFIFGPRHNSSPNDEATADDLIVAYRQLIDRAHQHGVKIFGGTLTPFEGSAYYFANGNSVRQAVNQWIRTSGAFDAVVDFDAVTRSSENPNKFRPDYDSGDHLHPGDAGYKAMAEAVDLKLFGARGK